MKIEIAQTAGFCMGVRRAVELALDAPDKFPHPIFTFGPLIHNPQVLSLLADKGIKVLDEIPDSGPGTVIIRAHGVPPETRNRLKAAGFTIVEATCPRVIKVQTIIARHAAMGYAVIIVGDADHPEVVGLLGHAGALGHIVSDMKSLEALPVFEKAIIVAQTTQHIPFFDAVCAWAEKKHPDYRIFQTICDSTQKRQNEVRRLSANVDAVIVVGGKSSGNTRRLARIAAQTGKPTFHIESEEELENAEIGAFATVGITAGASTPNWTIKKVIRYLEQLPAQRLRGWRKTLFHLQRTLLLTNIYVALGAGALCYAATRLLGIGPFSPYLFIAVTYVLSMHIMNHLTGRQADTYNDPARAGFYQRHKKALMLLATVAESAGLVKAFFVGRGPFLILLIMSITGLSYNFRFLPSDGGRFRYRRIRDIPGSKTVLIALAWGVVTVVLPALCEINAVTQPVIWVFLWVVGMVFVRTAFFDILDMQGDRIVGKETVPILLGERRALKHLDLALAFLTLLLPALSLLGILPSLGYFLVICPLLLWTVFAIHRKSTMLAGIRVEFRVESGFIAAGVIAFLWHQI